MFTPELCQGREKVVALSSYFRSSSAFASSFRIRSMCERRFVHIKRHEILLWIYPRISDITTRRLIITVLFTASLMISIHKPPVAEQREDEKALLFTTHLPTHLSTYIIRKQATCSLKLARKEGVMWWQMTDKRALNFHSAYRTSRWKWGVQEGLMGFVGVPTAEKRGWLHVLQYLETSWW